MPYSRVNIRKTHPGLYKLIMVLCLMRIALAINFWTASPAFHPYDIPDVWIGVVFFLLGASQLVFLNVFHNLRLVRLTMALSAGFMMFWGLTNTQQFFDGPASLQLPILYVALAIVQVPLIIESPVNPMTEKK